jgi:hypothetical protein
MALEGYNPRHGNHGSLRDLQQKQDTRPESQVDKAAQAGRSEQLECDANYFCATL